MTTSAAGRRRMATRWSPCPPTPLYGLLTGQMTVTDAVRHSTVNGDTEIARRALEPLFAAFSKTAPAT